MADPVFSAEQVSDDAKNRVARTGAQGGLASAVVVLGLWLAHQFGWSGEMPPEVVASLIATLTTLGSYWMNRQRIKGCPHRPEQG